MELSITHKVDNHHTNQGYNCLVVKFMSNDNNVRRRFDKDFVLFDWIPTDDEIILINKWLMNLSPTFKNKLCEVIP